MPPRSQNPKPIPTLTGGQDNTLFGIARQTAKLERQKLPDDIDAAVARTIRVRDHENAGSDLRVQLLREESQARIQTMMTPGNGAQQHGKGDKDDPNSVEIPAEVKTLSVRFAGLPQEEVVQIFNGKFKPVNLFKLRYMKGQSYEAYYGQDHIQIDNSKLRIKKSQGFYKNFGKSVHEVWAEAFINYQTIIVSFFGKTVPDLHAATNSFYQKILELSRVYDWERAVLPLAIDVHTNIVSVSASDPKAWVIPDPFQARFCNVSTALPAFMISTNQSFLGKRKRETNDIGPKPIRTQGEYTIAQMLFARYSVQDMVATVQVVKDHMNAKDVDLKDTTSLHAPANPLTNRNLLRETKN